MCVVESTAADLQVQARHKTIAEDRDQNLLFCSLVSVGEGMHESTNMLTSSTRRKHESAGTQAEGRKRRYGRKGRTEFKYANNKTRQQQLMLFLTTQTNNIPGHVLIWNAVVAVALPS
jgi:hypothetical protein